MRLNRILQILFLVSIILLNSEVRAERFQIVPSESTLTYFESDRGYGVYSWDLQFEGTLDVQLDPITNVATIANVNLSILGPTSDIVDDAWIRDRLEVSDFLTGQIDGHHMVLSGEYNRGNCGIGLSVEAALQPLSVPEPSMAVLSSFGVVAVASFAGTVRRRRVQDGNRD